MNNLVETPEPRPQVNVSALPQTNHKQLKISQKSTGINTSTCLEGGMTVLQHVNPMTSSKRCTLVVS